jgi:hypothetical protein
MQYSADILDSNVSPNLSKLTICGAPLLKQGDNHFAAFMLLSVFGKSRYKKHIHALLTVFHRRVDFACVAYRQGRTQLKKYTDKLPNDNSQSRHVRLATCYFESCVLHLASALKCGDAMLASMEKTDAPDERVTRLQKIANRIRHYDEDVVKDGKIAKIFGIAPVWISDAGLNTTKLSLSFSELFDLLNESVSECSEFNKILSEPNS